MAVRTGHFQQCFRSFNKCCFRGHNVSISRRLLKTICKTKALRSLTLGNSRFAEDITENFPTKTPPLTSLAIMEFSDTPEFPDSFASVVARVVTAEDLKSITAPNFDLISTLLPQTTALVELILTDMVCSRATWDAIGSLQALRTLEIERFAVEAADQEHPSRQAQLATSHLPNLQRLKGPLSFSYIVANRPISSLDLTGTVRLKDRQALVSFTSAPVDFPLIVQSSADIVSLFIHYNVYTEPFIDDIATQRAPVLSVLSLNFHFGVDVTWPACHYYDLELQRTLIPRITAGFPNLRKIQFFYYIEWSKPLNEDRWTGYIPLELYPILHLLLRKIGTTYKDVDGLLNAVIDTDSFGTL
ncbi:hypothetical protein DXG01_003671 [Tephrocybe rancida]|nr:hypothetical protein DXG01_003671 [Tephrocybe rancida]